MEFEFVVPRLSNIHELQVNLFYQIFVRSVSSLACEITTFGLSNVNNSKSGFQLCCRCHRSICRVQDQVRHHGFVDPHNFNVFVTNTVSISVFVITFAKVGLQSEDILRLHDLFGSSHIYRALRFHSQKSYERQLVHGKIFLPLVEMVETQMDDCGQRKY